MHNPPPKCKTCISQHNLLAQDVAQSSLQRFSLQSVPKSAGTLGTLFECSFVAFFVDLEGTPLDVCSIDSSSSRLLHSSLIMRSFLVWFESLLVLQTGKVQNRCNCLYISIGRADFSTFFFSTTALSPLKHI